MREDNLGGLILARVERFAGQTCLINKEERNWREISWREVGEETRSFAHGLVSLGIQKGDGVALLSENRKEWLYADFGILAAGGVTVTIYPTLLSPEIAYIINNSGSRFVIVSTRDQLAKVLFERANLPALEKIIVFEDFSPDGDPTVVRFSEVQRLGREHQKKNNGELERRIEATGPDDLATLVYTSGTTGPPKGAMITHGNVIFVARAIEKIIPVGPEDQTLSFLPYCHVYERVGGIYASAYKGIRIALAESLDRIADNMRDTRPTLVLGVPRVYEKAYAAVLASIEESGPFRRAIFQWARGVGSRSGPYLLEDRPLPWLLRLQFSLADRLVFSKLRERFGGKLRFFVTAAAPISQEIIEFFHSLGILILEGYGLTETSAPATVNRPGRVKFGTVGPPLPDVEVKLDVDGEILIRGENVFKGYYKDPELTKEVFTEDGWFRSGDVGEIDADGFLRITDRKKDLIITAGGKNIAPQNIENLMKTAKWISEAMVFGDRKKYLVALITLDEEAVRAFAASEGIGSSGIEELAKHPQVWKVLEEEMSKLNRELPQFSTIKRFQVLPRQFTLEAGEVTPTMKLKRRVIAEKYRALIDSMYEDEGRGQGN